MKLRLFGTKFRRGCERLESREHVNNDKSKQWPPLRSYYGKQFGYHFGCNMGTKTTTNDTSGCHLLKGLF